MFKEIDIDCETLAENLLEILVERYDHIDVIEMLFYRNYSWDEIFSIGFNEETVEQAKEIFERLG